MRWGPCPWCSAWRSGSAPPTGRWTTTGPGPTTRRSGRHRRFRPGGHYPRVRRHVHREPRRQRVRVDRRQRERRRHRRRGRERRCDQRDLPERAPDGVERDGGYFTDNGVVLWEVEQVRVRECNVSADAWWGVHVYYSNWTRILNCSITRNDWGIRMFHSNYTRIVGCDISRHRLVDGHAGIWIDDHCNHILIDNNSIYRNAAGIDVRIDMNIPTENLTVRCNDIRLNDNEAVWADHLRSGSIEHNHLHDNLGRGSTCTTPGAALWSAT
ncbi:MAG TPA: right-handed parallel beta-helix repeat-containing protein [Thermoplasmata archaeon]|nr:right-handed parallel beta-helix repeat-containing protein [Thermoplasmata archaeon]